MKDLIKNPFFYFDNKEISSDALSYRRVAFKTLILTLLSMIVAVYYWSIIVDKSRAGTLSGTIHAWIIFLSPFVAIGISYFSLQVERLHPSIAVAFSISVGIFYGSFSSIFDRAGTGIILNAAVCTFVTFISCLIVSIVTNGKVSDLFLKFIIFCVSIICWIFAYNLIMSFLFLHWENLLAPHTKTSLFITIIGAVIAASITIVELSIIKDLRDEDRGLEQEWNLATGLLFNMVWIYLCYIFIIAWGKRK